MTPLLDKAGAAFVLALAALAAAPGARAATTTLSGDVGDSGNAALVGSDLGGADFSSEQAVANNVALYTFTLGQAGAVTIASTGWSAGGIDPYVTLFSGTGASATFEASAIDDFSWTDTLSAGSYTIAIATWENMSFAENHGSGTLGDGFIGVGDPNWIGDGHYALTLTTPVPEPASAWLLAMGLAAGLASVAVRTRQDRRAR